MASMASSNSFHGSTGQNAKLFNWLNSQIRDEYKDQCNGQTTFNCWGAQTAKSCPVGLISQNNRISLISSTFEMVNLVYLTNCQTCWKLWSKEVLLLSNPQWNRWWVPWWIACNYWCVIVIKSINWEWYSGLQQIPTATTSSTTKIRR